jgi:preprotein translocase subunit SecE
MAKGNGGGPGVWSRWFRELTSLELYKRSQGRMVRQLTCLAIWVAVALIAYRVWKTLPYLRLFGTEPHLAIVYTVPIVVLLAGLWLGFRLVNWPSFADFLIAVEAEMNKVSWPSRTELIRASLVVIVLMFGLTLVLFFYDVALTWLLTKVLRVTII